MQYTALHREDEWPDVQRSPGAIDRLGKKKEFWEKAMYEARYNSGEEDK